MKKAVWFNIVSNVVPHNDRLPQREELTKLKYLKFKSQPILLVIQEAQLL